MTEPYVNSEINNSIATITFFHPAHNSLPGKLLAQLADEITKAGQNDEVKVVILRSGGNRTFCAGASFKELIHIENKEEGEQFFSGFANVINAMRKCPKFIIGRIQGKTVGGGVGLASATDYCLATKYAAIKLSELNLGIGPFVVGPAVERKIGLSGMSQIAINASEFYSAEWAKQKGLFADVLDSTETLDEAVKELSDKLCGYNPEAVKHMKQMFWRGTEDWDELLQQRAKISGELVLSKFTKEKLARFKDK
ncbi:MAG: enoyl-CoA hydratase/isomerase family protein [Psychroflexus sp.]|jgi:methylglutaconyl-CoA hydratase|nr:enoyl-CoA hydratase/isomerase family protein [Psychroflexus sp.]MDR9448640.1 enoyl-CoA hydratase/isomerase family protein [Psychroflexus sp.]